MVVWKEVSCTDGGYLYLGRHCKHDVSTMRSHTIHNSMPKRQDPSVGVLLLGCTRPYPRAVVSYARAIRSRCDARDRHTAFGEYENNSHACIGLNYSMRSNS